LLGLAAFLTLALAAPPQIAGTRTLSWSPSAGAGGYRVHYGDVSGDYSATVDVGNVTQHTIAEDLDDCTRWYFAVTAYNAIGESGYSPEATWLTPLTIDDVDPEVAAQQIVQGAQFSVTVNGAAFESGAEITVNHADWVCPPGLGASACNALLAMLRDTVTFGTPTVTCNEIQVLVSIDPVLSGAMAAIPGTYSLRVTNPDDETVNLTQAFQILKNQGRFDVNQSTNGTTDRLDGADVIWISKQFNACLPPGVASSPCSQNGANYETDYDFDGDGWVDGSDLADVAANFGRCWDGASWKTSACQ
jgi:hypothetical protein